MRFSSLLGLVGSALIFAQTPLAQSGSTPAWPEPVPARDEVTVTMRASASGGPFGLLAQVVLADGTKFGSIDGGRGRGADPQ